MASIKDLVGKEVIEKLKRNVHSSKRITQDAAALIQLIKAIELYQAKDFICAITLAGAAEEILGELALSTSKTNSFLINEFLFDSFRDILGIRDYKAYRNRIKNNLKHLDKGKRSISTSYFEIYSFQLIASAITNYKLYKGKLPKEKIISGFCEKYGIN